MRVYLLEFLSRNWFSSLIPPTLSGFRCTFGKLCQPLVVCLVGQIGELWLTKNMLDLNKHREGNIPTDPLCTASIGRHRSGLLFI